MSVYRCYCLIIVIILLIALPAFAQDDIPLFEASFEDTAIPSALKIQYGTYEVVDGNLSYTVQNGGFLLIPSGITWTDYAIETRLKIESGSVWLQARTGSDLCSGYYLTITASMDVFELSSANQNCDFTVLQASESLAIPNDWVVARIDVEGNQIRAYMDGKLVLDVTDAQYTTGYPTINVFPIEDEDKAQVEFDSIRVFALPETMPAESTPEPELTPEPEPTLEPESTPELESVELPVVTEVPLSDDPQQMVETLQELGLIPTGEGQLYTDEATILSRVGAWFEPLFADVTTLNVAMSAHIDFLPNSDAESCLLSARITRDEVGVAQRYLDVGLDSRSEIFVGETADNGDYSQATQDGLVAEPEADVLFIAYGDKLSVFVNGKAVFQNISVTRRVGSLGVSSIATTSYSVCRVSNIWAYMFGE